MHVIGKKYYCCIDLTFLQMVFNFFDNSAIVFILSLSLKDFCIVSPSMSNSVSSPSFHKFNLLFKASKWSLDFEFLAGFWRSKFGMTMIALNATSCKGKLCIQELTNRVVSSMYCLPDLPDQSKKIFFLQKTTLS